MMELFYNALRKTSIGIIILDVSQRIVFFNESIEKLCSISEKNALGKQIDAVLPVFTSPVYKKIIEFVLQTGQSRFCSSALHKSFVFSKEETRDSRRQNMKVEYVSINNEDYVFIQIIDISESYDNEQKLQDRIHQLQKGYDDLKFTKIVTERLAKYDSLTGLLNRYYFDIKFNGIISEALQNNELVAIVFIDLDGFKKVNDTQGHMVGDALLQLVASRIKNNMKKSDFAMRMGGDEFVIAIKNSFGKDYIENSVNDLLSVLRKPYYIDNQMLSISASMGVSFFPVDGKSLGELIDKSDKAMYYAKNNGKNCVFIYRENDQ